LWEVNPSEVWRAKARPPPKTNAPSSNINIDYVYFVEDSLRGVSPYGPEADSQIPPSEERLFHDPEYPIEAYAS